MHFYMPALLVIEVQFKIQKTKYSDKYFIENNIIWVLGDANLKVGKACSHLTFIIFHAWQNYSRIIHPVI